MTKIDIFSGFLGAGKTTLIKKLIAEAYQDQKLVLIENEFGDIGIDGGFLKDAGIEIREMNSGCICCSLVGDFKEALKKVLAEMKPDRILIEPSGVGKLSDVIAAVKSIEDDAPAKLDHFVTVVDVQKCRLYMKNFGEFFNDQIACAKTIILSRTQLVSEEKLEQAVGMIREKNDQARILTTPWDQLAAAKIVEAMDASDMTISEELLQEAERHHLEHEHEHHHDHEHEHEHDHEHHHHHHHHDADEIFQTWGCETAKAFDKEHLEHILAALNDEKYGQVLRAKGIVASKDGSDWLYFDQVPEESEVRLGTPDYTGRICVIGADLKTEAIADLFMGE